MSVGIRTLESDRGRQGLEMVGAAVIQAWDDEDMSFDGDIRLIKSYVNHFLFRVRNDFPMVMLSDKLHNPDTLAMTVRNEPGVPPARWDGNLQDYKPVVATGIYFNSGRVKAMAQNFASSTLPHRQARERDVIFQFLFGMTTCHELVHAFIGYLAGTQGDMDESYTPLQVTVSGYSQSIVGRDGSRLPKGESGRVFDLFMYGGTVEFYRDPEHGDDQPGVPYLLDANGVARRLTHACVNDQILYPEDPSRYPLGTHPGDFDEAARIQRPLRSMGAAFPLDSAGLDIGRFMTAAVKKYYVSDEEVRQALLTHRKVRLVTVG